MPIGQKDPWDKPQQSPQLDIDQYLKKVKKFIIPAVVVLVLIIAGTSTYFTVEPEEEAVILRFGAYTETVGPGLHFKLPFGIDKAFIRKVETMHKQDFGFRSVVEAEPRFGRQVSRSRRAYDSPKLKEESLMLSADLNMAVVNWVVRYKIKDIKDYLFNVRNVEETIRDVSEAVMRRIFGDRSIDEVLMIKTQEIEDMALAGTREFLDKYKCGIYVESVKLKSVNPPDEVKDAFDAVPQARQSKERIITDAEAKRNREIPLAEGMKKRRIAESEGYREKRVKEAQGDAAAFLAVWKEYQKAKDITRRRLYLETMAKVLPRCGKLYLIDEDQKGILPLLNLNGERLGRQGGGR